MSGQVIYKKKHFIITKHGKDYIVQNTDHKHEFKHSHINNYHLGVLLIDTCLLGDIPKTAKHLNSNKRFIESAIRLCRKEDKATFKEKLKSLE